MSLPLRECDPTPCGCGCGTTVYYGVESRGRMWLGVPHLLDGVTSGKWSQKRGMTDELPPPHILALLRAKGLTDRDLLGVQRRVPTRKAVHVR